MRGLIDDLQLRGPGLHFLDGGQLELVFRGCQNRDAMRLAGSEKIGLHVGTVGAEAMAGKPEWISDPDRLWRIDDPHLLRRILPGALQNIAGAKAYVNLAYFLGITAGAGDQILARGESGLQKHAAMLVRRPAIHDNAVQGLDVDWPGVFRDGESERLPVVNIIRNDKS